MGGVDIEIDAGAVQAINVPLTAVDVTPFQGSGTLYGWSLREASSAVPTAVEGQSVAPAAGGTIVTTAALPAGTYDVAWTVELIGAAAAADQNNFQLFNGAGAVLQSVNPGAAGQYPQPGVRITVAQGATVSIKAVGAGTAGITYAASLTLTPDAFIGFQSELQGGNSPLGEPAADFQESDTVWLAPLGVAIEQKVTLHVVAGAVTGCLYIAPDY